MAKVYQEKDDHFTFTKERHIVEPMKKDPSIYAVIGPTASGKSDFAVELAKRIHGEIISADSRQIYKGLDIGTGKITKKEMKGVGHYMLDIKSPGERFSVAEYVEIVLPIIEDIIARGKTPILCGGTGQYIHAVLYKNTFPKVKPNEPLRQALEKNSSEELFALLLKKDPIRAASIDKHNKVRIIRALEILEQEKSVPTLKRLQKRFPFHIYEMDIDRELLRTRIIKRLEKRLDDGMLDEVKDILTTNPTEQELKRDGIEYIILGKYLRGDYSLDEAKEILIAKIYQYAKRQMTWNKKYFKETEKIVVGS